MKNSNDMEKATHQQPRSKGLKYPKGRLSRPQQHARPQLSVLTLSLLAALHLSALNISPAQADDSQKFIVEAKNYVQQGNVKAAIIQLKNALQKNPDDKDARFMLGEIYLKVGDGPSAAKELKRAQDLGVTGDKLLPLLGKAYLLQGRNEAVLQEIQEPANAPAALKASIMTLHGHANLALRKFDQAKEKYQEALAAREGFPDALIGQARIAFMEKNPERAMSLTEQALKNDPKSVESWIMKGDLQRAAGRHAESLQTFQKILQLDPENITAYLGRAAEQLALGKIAEAKKDIEAVRSRVPGHPLANYLSAHASFQEKNLNAARDSLQQVLKVIPGHLPSLLLMGNVHYLQNQLSQAEDELSRYVHAVPDQASARRLLAATLMKLKRPQEAIKALEPALKGNEKDPQLLALLGSAYMQSGKLEQGTEYLEQAATLAPDAADIRTQLAVSRLAAGETDLAVKELESIVELGKEPMQADVLLVLSHLQKRNFDKALQAAQAMSRKEANNPVPYNFMGAAYLGKKDLAAARKQFERALQVQPQFTPAHMNLARIDTDQKKPQQAEQHYRNVLKYDDKHAGAMIGLASLSAAAGKESEAMTWLEKARERNPKALEPVLLLINIHLTKNEPLKALSVAQSIAEDQADNPVVLQALAQAQLAAGETSSAVSTLRKLTEKLPKSAQAQHLLATAQITAKDSKAATVSLNKALKLDPNYIPAAALLAELEVRDNRPKEALRMARQIQQQQPKSAAGYELEGNIHMAGRAYANAAAAYAEAHQRGKSAALAVKLSGARKQAGDAAGAYQPLTQWLNEHPDDAAVRTVLAGTYQSENKRKEAVEHYQKVITSQPKNALVLNNLAWLYYEQNDARAVEYAEKAYDLVPDQPAIIDTLGWILVQKGQVKRGLELLRAASAKAPTSLEIRYHLAAALDKAGRREEARKELERILKDNENFSEIEAARALLRRIKEGV